MSPPLKTRVRQRAFPRVIAAVSRAAVRILYQANATEQR